VNLDERLIRNNGRILNERSNPLTVEFLKRDQVLTAGQCPRRDGRPDLRSDVKSQEVHEISKSSCPLPSPFGAQISLQQSGKFVQGAKEVVAGSLVPPGPGRVIPYAHSILQSRLEV